MKPFPAVILATLGAAVCPGSPADRAILAAMKLSEQPNYSWSCSVTDDARSYVIEGKTEQPGLTWVRLPMVKAIAQRLGREADFEIEAYFRGTDTPVIRTERGWQTLRELPRRHWRRDDDIELWPQLPPPPGTLGRAGRRGMDPLEGLADLEPPPVSGRRAPFPYEDDDKLPYSNAQFGVSHPHDELAIIVSSNTGLNVEGNVVTGILGDIGAQLLLVRDGQDHIQPVRAGGMFQLLVKDGLVVRYQLRLEGILLVDRKRVFVQQTSSTVLNNIGATRIDLPAEARRKLGL